MRLVTWNLFHGRADPPAGHDLFDAFAATLAGWAWDVALLQEVPPWWPAALGRACDASARSALTSRNTLPAPRRAIARRFPDVIKANGGGANAILVRGRTIDEHRSEVLRRWPERRVVHAVRLGELWVANLHAQVHSEARAQADLATALGALDRWSGGGPAVLGGDTNTRAPLLPGFVICAMEDVDVVAARGVCSAGTRELPARGTLSDHAAVAVDLAT